VFAIDDSSAALRVFILNPYLDASHALGAVVTTEPVLSASMLTTYRMPLAHGVDYLVGVEQYEGVTSPDDFAQVPKARSVINPGAAFTTTN
jgi:hypothetical protein